MWTAPQNCYWESNRNLPVLTKAFLARVQAYSIGYDREFPIIPQLSTALGAQVTFYHKPGFLTPIYGEHPAGVIVFVRVRPVSSMHMHH